MKGIKRLIAVLSVGTLVVGSFSTPTFASQTSLENSANFTVDSDWEDVEPDDVIEGESDNGDVGFGTLTLREKMRKTKPKIWASAYGKNITMHVDRISVSGVNWQFAWKKQGASKWHYKNTGTVRNCFTTVYYGNSVYGVSVRAYRMINGKKVYTKWSKTKTVTTTVLTSASSIADKKGVQSLCGFVNNYIAKVSTVGNGFPKGGFIPFTIGNRADIAAASLDIYSDNGIDYSDSIKNGKYYCAKTNKIMRFHKDLFGSALEVDQVPTSDLITYKNYRLYVLVADWGGYVPSYRITKCKKLSDGKYRLTIKNQFYKPSKGRFVSYGKTNITIINNKKSNFGYTISEITFKN